MLSRIMGLSIRSWWVAYPQANRPLTQEWPLLALPSFQGTMRTTSWPFISALKAQPTPQYAQVVTTACSACPISITDFSMSVDVGQACTQAPQDTQSLDMKSSSWPAATRELNPRPAIVSAKVPCTSSQARTQRLHTMHLDGS